MVTPKLLPVAAGVVVPPSEVACLEIAVNNQVGGSWWDLSGVSGFIVLPFLFPAELVFAVADPEEAKNLAGESSA